MVGTTVKACFYFIGLLRPIHVIPPAAIFHGAAYEGRSN